MQIRFKFGLGLLLLATMFGACQEGQKIIVPDNNSPSYDGVPTIILENYINRSYIDLLGREPLDGELTRDVTALRAGDLQEPARRDFISQLQNSETFVEGDSSYKQAYYQRFYEAVKARMIEGVSDGDISGQLGIYRFDAIRDSLNGDWPGYERNLANMKKLQNILDSRWQYREGTIPVNEVFGRTLYNYFYDEINMNSINFIRACFNDLFFRYHTQAEFDESFQIIEFGLPGQIFGQSATNKEEYIAILVNSREFHEGMIRWAYKNLLAREPDAAETDGFMQDFYTDKNFQKIQLEIMVTDEYANF
jgi:hypothetical protein